MSLSALLIPLFLLPSLALSSKIPSNVIELNERFLDVSSDGLWFVKFYAPWCAHCKRLTPTWEQMAHSLADAGSKVSIGRVDCTRFQATCNKLDIHGYPTLLFFRHGKHIPYEGDRRKEALVTFALKSAGPVVQKLEGGQTRFYAMKESSEREPFFVYLIDEPSDFERYHEFEAMAERLFTDVSFYQAEMGDLPPSIAGSLAAHQSPHVLVVKDQTHYRYPPEEYEGKNLSEWIQAERWTLLPHTSYGNLREMSDSSGKRLAIGVVEGHDRGNVSTESGQFFAKFRKAAQLARDDPHLRDAFQFGWTDELQMMNGIAMSYLSAPCLLVFNYSSYEFYLPEDSPNAMTPQSIHLWLQRVEDGNVTVSGGRSWPTRLRRMVFDITSNLFDMFYSQPILTTCLFGVPLAFFTIIVYSVCSSDFTVDRDEIYPAGEDEEGEDETDFSDYEGVEMDDAEAVGATREEEQRALVDAEGEAKASDGGHQKAE